MNPPTIGNGSTRNAAAPSLDLNIDPPASPTGALPQARSDDAPQPRTVAPELPDPQLGRASARRRANSAAEHAESPPAQRARVIEPAATQRTPLPTDLLVFPGFWRSTASFLNQRELTQLRSVSMALNSAATHAISKLTVGDRAELAHALTTFAANRPIKLNIHSTALLIDDLQLLADNPSITELVARDCGIDGQGAQRLAASDSIVRLDLSEDQDDWAPEFRHNRIRDAGVQALASRNIIEWLDLSCNDFGVAGARALGLNESIKWLNVSECRLGDDEAVELAKSKTIETLNLSFNDLLGQDGGRGIVALAESTSLKQLSLKGCAVDASAAAHLGRTTSITELDLAESGINEAALLAFLAGKNAITSLDLSESVLGFNSLVALSRNPTIARLTLSDCRGIDADGLAQLATNMALRFLCLDIIHTVDAGAAAIAGTQSIRELHLVQNGIGDAGAAALAVNTSIHSLNLGSNEVEDAGAIALASNRHLLRLDLGENAVGDDGAVALAGSSSLIELLLCSNRIGERGALALAANRTIKILDLRGNTIGAAARQAFEAVRDQYSNLRLG